MRKLRAIEGVRSVRHNAKAGSVTVCYDVRTTDADAILGLIRNDCLKSCGARPVVKRARPKQPSGGLTAEIGRMALGALVSRGVGYSLTSLLGVRA
jgi:hypothetical protein